MRIAVWLGRSGRFVALAAALFGLVLAAWIGAAQSDASQSQAAPAGEMAERAALKQSVRDLFEAADYPALERLSSYYRSSGARTPSGIWRLTVFYGAFHDLAESINRDDAAGWQQLSAKLAVWRSQFTASPTPRVLQAIALKSFAWSLRPRTILVDVSTGSDARFLAALANARDLLDTDKTIASADPHYYVLRTDVGTALGEAPDQVMALVEEGRAKFPGYFALDFSGLDYFAVGNGLQAMGPAEAARIDAFANSAASAAGAGADERYARLYWHASVAFFGNDLFQRTRANWPRMRAGFNQIAARYPNAWNVNSFALLSCLAGDRETTRDLMAQLPERPLLKAIWQARPMFAGCRQWANADTALRR